MKPKICLNMIVKNESKIIKETLQNVSKYIDYWVISDTGSTDNTIEVVVEFFKEKQIPGKIFQDNWEDFGSNRTKAIKHAYNICDYIWVMDADDIVNGTMVFPEKMEADMYNFKFGTSVTYIRPLMFKSSLKWRYRGVVHEYIECIDKKNPVSHFIEGNYFIDSRRLGHRSADPEKYLKDAHTLIKALEDNKEPDLKSRYLFYTGQSFFDYRNFKDALKWYKKRVKQGGWIEETYYSSLRCCFCMEQLKYSETEIIEQYLKTYSFINERPEAFYQLAIFFKKNAVKDSQDIDKEKLSKSLFYLLQLSKQVVNPEVNKKRLFLNNDIYVWSREYELANVYFLLGKKQTTVSLCKELLSKPTIRMDIKKYEIITSLMLKATTYDDNALSVYPKDKINELIKAQEEQEQSDSSKKNLVCTMTTCKRLKLFMKTIHSFIHCCKDIHLIDKWIFVDDNSSVEDRDVMKYDYPFIEWVFKDKDNKGHASSMNIIHEKTKDFNYILHMEDDWLFIENTFYIKPALDILSVQTNAVNFLDSRGQEVSKEKEIGQVLFNINYAEDIDNIIYGGFLAETKSKFQTKFIIHEHYPDRYNYPLKNRLNSAYWEHYSFRPSIVKRKVLDTVGTYDTSGFFEGAYAKRYFENGFISCFMDKVSCIHIGKKTYASSDTVMNAYELNEENQFLYNKPSDPMEYDKTQFIFLPNQDSFGNDISFMGVKSIQELSTFANDIKNCICFNSYGYMKSKLNKELISLPNKFNKVDGLFIHKKRLHQEILCLNLQRRQDRKEKMEIQFNALNLEHSFFKAVDGYQLKPSNEISRLFKNNDFGARKGFIGCALSHMSIWKHLLTEPHKEYYIVTEDDATLHPRFKEYLGDVQDKLHKINNWDFMFLGYFTHSGKEYLYNSEHFDKEHPIDIEVIEFDNPNYIGGFFGYMISATGAKKLLDYIEDKGVNHGIDYLIKICNGLNVYQLKTFIIKSDWVKNLESPVDSDIQKSYESLDIYSDDDFEFIKEFDSKDNDITAYRDKPVDELKTIALSMDNCVCFNTLGYMKSNLVSLTKSIYLHRSADGLYIKKKYLKTLDAMKKLNGNHTIRVKMLCNWMDSKSLCDQWNWMSQGNYRWNNIEITWEDAGVDYYVIINKPRGEDYYVKSKTIVYQMEPMCLDSNQSWGVKTWVEWANPDPSQFLQVRTSEKYLNAVQWLYELSYDYFKTTEIVKDESKGTIISSVCSPKYFDPGHIKRVDFLRYIEQRQEPDIHLNIYSANNTHNFHSYVGPLKDDKKELGILPYKYYFMCENNSETNFITEKLWEPIIGEALVFYWGCPNVSDYIDPLAYVQLDMDDFAKSFQIVKEAIQNNLWEQRIDVIRKEKQKILDYYNFFPTLERTFKELGIITEKTVVSEEPVKQLNKNEDMD